MCNVTLLVLEVTSPAADSHVDCNDGSDGDAHGGERQPTPRVMMQPTPRVMMRLASRMVESAAPGRQGPHDLGLRPNPFVRTGGSGGPCVPWACALVRDHVAYVSCACVFACPLVLHARAAGAPPKWTPRGAEMTLLSSIRPSRPIQLQPRGLWAVDCTERPCRPKGGGWPVVERSGRRGPSHAAAHRWRLLNAHWGWRSVLKERKERKTCARCQACVKGALASKSHRSARGGTAGCIHMAGWGIHTSSCFVGAATCFRGLGWRGCNHNCGGRTPGRGLPSATQAHMRDAVRCRSVLWWLDARPACHTLKGRARCARVARVLAQGGGAKGRD
jgi:hypothetical protein